MGRRVHRLVREHIYRRAGGLLGELSGIGGLDERRPDRDAGSTQAALARH
jgi:hypothetical protein